MTFGLFFADYDLDGREDLFQANGHLEQEINQVQPSQHYAQPPQLFWNCGPDCRASFVAVPEQRLGDLAAPTSATILVGPEGGLERAEIEAAATAGFQPVRLGPRILRTETAALAILAAMQTLWGDFRA